MLWAFWVVSRAALFWLATNPRLIGDVGVYQHWYNCCLSRGKFPLSDPMWQYPPGAALVIWLPGHLPMHYADAFAALTVGCDLIITLLLWAAARRGGSLLGAWYWVCGVPLLGAISLGRFDMASVVLVAAALQIRGRGAGRGLLRGALIGVATAIKIWPITALVGEPPGRQWRRTLAGAAAMLAVVAVCFPHETASFLNHQYERGVEIESVVATPFMVWRLMGWHVRIVFRYGSWQLSAEHIAIAQDVSRFGLLLAGVAIIGWWLLLGTGRIRWRPEFATDAPLTATLLFVVLSPVLSPQYLLWLLGLAAVCLATGQTRQRPVAVAVIVAAGLTQLNFPWDGASLLGGSALLTGVLVARNVLLVGAAAVSCWRLVRPVRAGLTLLDESFEGLMASDR